MITPGTYDLPPMIRGTNYEFGFIIKTDGIVKDLTGCTIEISLLNADGIADTLTTDHCLIITPADGAITLDIDDSVITTYPLGEFIYHLNITETNGDINRYMEGRVAVRE